MSSGGWRPVAEPDFVASVVTRHSCGCALVGGSVEGRGVLLAYRAPADYQRVDLDAGPVVSAASDGSGYTIGTADGQVLVGELDGELEPLAVGLSPFAVWCTVGDIDHRAVLAQEGPDGPELALWSAEQGVDQLVPVPNRLFLRGAPVVVTSHQGTVVVAGPVDDGNAAGSPSAWFSVDPDFGDAPWRELPLEPRPDEFTGAWNGAIWFYLAGHRGWRPLAWDQEGRPLTVPDVDLDPAHPVVLIADVDVDSDEAVFALQALDGPQLWWRGADGWRSGDLPPGRLGSAAVVEASEDSVDGELLAVVVDGTAYFGPLPWSS